MRKLLATAVVVTLATLGGVGAAGMVRAADQSVRTARAGVACELEPASCR